MAEDRRCFAFFHPALPGEPLIFTELALTRDMSSNAQALLDPESPTLDPSTCNCAMFYSINSCHEGLRGVPLGNALIARVTSQLTRELPRLDTFATLSPVPGFRSWLATLARPHAGYVAQSAAAATLACLERSDWYASRDTSAALERQLVPLCAYVLAPRQARRQPCGPRRPFSPPERRASRAAQLAERYLDGRAAGFCRPNGQLRLSLSPSAMRL